MPAMWSRPSRPRLTLSSQLLLWQMVIVVLVVGAVAGMSTVQTNASFARDTERRMLSSAEVLSANNVVRNQLEDRDQPEATKVEAEIRRSFAAATYVLVVDASGKVLTSTIPEQGSSRLPVGPGSTLTGRTWTGATERFGNQAVEAHVPVLSVREGSEGRRIGHVVIGTKYPAWWQVLVTSSPLVLGYLLLGGFIGVLASLLLARRVKRQTLGLEPREISALVEQREAMLHGVREGVVGVDPRGRISFANDEALRLLGWTPDVVGRPVDEVTPSPELAAILRGSEPIADVAAVTNRRVLVLNTLPIHVRGRRTGSVATMRDRTELLDVQQQLAAAQDHTDTLRAQVHEFRNRLHAIGGMVELEEREELLEFIGAITDAMDKRLDQIARQIGDPAVAALLMAKSLRADELALGLDIESSSRLEPHSAALSADLVTVIGNLVDNAFEALGPGGGDVRVAIRDQDDLVSVEVSDTGSGLTPEMGDVFEIGRTSKTSPDGEHGWGLALTRMACQRNNGDIRVEPGPPTRFIAELRTSDV